MYIHLWATQSMNQELDSMVVCLISPVCFSVFIFCRLQEKK